MVEGLATISTAIVNLFLCSVDKPQIPVSPTMAVLRLHHFIHKNLTYINGLSSSSDSHYSLNASVTPRSNCSLSSVTPGALISSNILLQLSWENQDRPVSANLPEVGAKNKSSYKREEEPNRGCNQDFKSTIVFIGRA
ncbi:hypothetical protein LWI28_021176 [Acer negundo]|uniref:Uncharacterized protein n=1 Tax=Acer negundo TaxID=4023 RepID=A0AAD5IFN8_ACENE|nr:hypothetical protein LWI28_021176 [Acer negundo]